MSEFPMIHKGNGGPMGVAHPRYFVGIDPDVDKSGLVVVDKQERRVMYAGALTFPDILLYLRMVMQQHAQEPHALLLVFEDSDKSVNWHYNSRQGAGQIAAIGRSVGMCHATTRHLKECAEQMGLPVLMQPPFRKCWKGPDGKITHEECQQFAVGLPKKTNQEVRDALLLAWLSADLPIRIQPK